MLKKILKNTTRSLGYEILRSSVYTNHELLFSTVLAHFEVDAVIDIGANSGQFAKQLLDAGFQGEITSIEPTSSAHALLTKNALSHPNWNVYPRTALGSKTGSIEINIAGNSSSSSLLPMTKEHQTAAPESSYVGRETCPITRLDDMALFKGKPTSILTKIDTQGYEAEVISGGQRTLSQSSLVLCELSFTTLYSGQRLWREITDLLGELQFEIWTIWPMFMNEQSGQTLQADAIFYRPNSTN